MLAAGLRTMMSDAITSPLASTTIPQEGASLGDLAAAALPTRRFRDTDHFDGHDRWQHAPGCIAHRLCHRLTELRRVGRSSVCASRLTACRRSRLERSWVTGQSAVRQARTSRRSFSEGSPRDRVSYGFNRIGSTSASRWIVIDNASRRSMRRSRSISVCWSPTRWPLSNKIKSSGRSLALAAGESLNDRVDINRSRLEDVRNQYQSECCQVVRLVHASESGCLLWESSSPVLR